MSTLIGFDTSTALVTVAAMRDRSCLAEASVGPGPDGRPRHAASLMPEIERALAAAGGWPAVDRIAVGIGPGSFTGLRVGVATARALGQALGKPMAAVCSLDVLGAAMAEGPARGPLLALIDARRSQVFAALYDDDGTRLWDPFVAAPELVAERLAGLPRPPLAAGDGAIRFEPALTAAGARVAPLADRLHRVDARFVCRLGEAAPALRPAEVKPLYLRAPDAELWLERDSR